MREIQLTSEQEAIVDHDHGPAVVFAVAGSGKTTAMVHRVERLVREDVFAAEEVLATSFSKACVDDLRVALQQWSHCQAVQPRTLHALGRRLLARAPPGPRPVRPGSSPVGPSGADYTVLSQALKLARRRGVAYKNQLDELDRDDFLHYVGDCKGNLRYANLEAADLPDAALALASQATAPDGFEHYLDLYQLYEEVRRQRGIVTFDDMLLGGWEVLQRYPTLLEWARDWYACILVDEFQDVNLAQFEILRLLAAPENNLMVVGDDDQTIYEWRGARPEFILSFEDRFDARTYRIQDNFRCPAPQVALANRVIEHNDNRVDKRLNLTQGFEGRVDITGHEGETGMGRAVVDQVLEHHREGKRLNEVSVLLRVYAQSAYIEHHLIDEGIPYQIVGSAPFYERREVQTVLAYLRLALYDAEFVRHGKAPTPEGSNDLGELLCLVANAAAEPRYISHDRARQAAKAVLRENLTIHGALRAAGEDAPAYAARGLRRLAADLEWLRKGVFNRDARELLLGLDERVGYRAYLQENSGFDETGEGRARNVTAFIDYANTVESVPALLTNIRALGEAHEQPGGFDDVLDIRTIHRAKGLEWPVVIVPHCNEGTLPFSRAFGRRDRLEEERRLLYVALTRARETTHLHHLTDTRTSRFLCEGRAEQTLDDVDAIQRLLGVSPRSWAPEDVVTALGLVHELDLERYLERWWPASRARKRSVARSVHTLLAQAREEGLVDRLDLADEELGYWRTAFEPPGHLPPGGLGVDLETILPEPAPEPDTRDVGQTTLASVPEADVIHQLHRGVEVRHPERGAGEVLDKKHFRGKRDVLVAFPEGERAWIDLNEDSLEIVDDGGPDEEPDAGPRRPAGAETGTGGQASQRPGEGALFEALKAVRLERANADGVPAYVVAHDATLERIVQARPTTVEALAQIKGVGPHFLDEHAEAFLEVLRTEGQQIAAVEEG